MACSNCALLLIGASGVDTVGFLYRDGDTYSGTVDLQQRNAGFGFAGDLQEFQDAVTMDVAIGLTCSVKNPRPMKLKCVVSGINHRIKSHRITAKSGWGVGP